MNCCYFIKLWYFVLFPEWKIDVLQGQVFAYLVVYWSFYILNLILLLTNVCNFGYLTKQFQLQWLDKMLWSAVILNRLWKWYYAFILAVIWDSLTTITFRWSRIPWCRSTAYLCLACAKSRTYMRSNNIIKFILRRY